MSHDPPVQVTAPEAQADALPAPPPATNVGPMPSPQGSARAAVPSPVVILVGLAAGFFVLAAMRDSQDIVAPAVLALVIAIAVSPLQMWLARHMPAWLGMIITLLITYTLLLAFVAALAWSLYAFGSEIPQYQDDLTSLLDDTTARLTASGVGREQIDALIGNIDLGAAAGVALSVAQGL